MIIRTIEMRWVTAVTLMVVSLGATAQDAGILARSALFSIPPQSLASALIDFSTQSGVQVGTTVEISKVQSKGVSGTRPLGEALTLLLDGTGLQFGAVGNTIAIREKPNSNPAVSLDFRDEVNAEEYSLQLAQSGEAEGNAAKDQPKRATPASSDNSGEIVVTGSHIRGGASASPIMTFTREDFDRAGATTTQQFLSTLPQVFGGSYSEDTTNEDATNSFPSFGSAVDLRGMGAGATLVLVNGRRMAASGFGNYTDISLIPLGAVERIDVLMDGASAAYGSDAISGVVNFIMKENYSGAETSVVGGASTRGDAENYQISQTFGTAGPFGSASVSYQYSRRESAQAVDRSFSRNAVGPIDLVPDQESQSVFVQGRGVISPRLTAFGDLLWSDRHSEYDNYDPFTPESRYMLADVKQLNGTAGLQFHPGNDWEIVLSGSKGRNELNQRTDASSQFAGRGSSYIPGRYTLSLAEIKAAGPLFALPTGPVKVAAGAGYREDEFGFFLSYSVIGVTNAPPAEELSSRYAFTELQVPVLSGRNGLQGPARLLFTAAARHEDYDAFGTTLDPKFGLRWAPSRSLALRATYGTSFKAPGMYQLNEAYNGFRTARNIRDARSGATVRTILMLGNNADLQPETATTWTAGLDLSPSRWPGLKVGLTWFDISYKGRIESPAVGGPDAQFNNADYSGLLTRRGSISDAEFNARLADLLSGQIRFSPTSCGVPLNLTTGECAEPVTNFNAILDSRTVNLAQAHTRGTDLSMSYRLERGQDSFDVNMNASYLFDYERNVTSSTPEVDLLSQALFPVDLKVRLGASWSRGAWSSNAAVSYTDSYIDNVSIPNATISSWTIVDFGVQYTMLTDTRIKWFSDSSARLHIGNVFDAAPPYYAAQLANLGYDATNADPIGRTWMLSWRKRW